jgi:hypothetical protein
MHTRQLIALGAIAGLSATPATLPAAGPGQISGNEFNPAVSLILDGRYSDLDYDDLKLPGFQIGGEAELPDEGFSLGHSELSISANVDDKLYGFFTAGIEYEDGETEVELEEGYIETLGLGGGVTLRAGKFFSGIGYLNEIHLHAHDFADRPLVYNGMLGGRLADVGVQARWTAPTPLFLQFGGEVTRGDGFPGGENPSGNEGAALFAKLGGDIGASQAWQAGVSWYDSSFDAREGGGHHGEEAGSVLSDGEVSLYGVDVVWKWAPNGNPIQRNLKLQAEYFVRDENGLVSFEEDGTLAQADYDGDDQTGYYVQAVYQFTRGWRVGLRYDRLESDNRLSNYDGNVGGGGTPIDFEEFAEESGFGSLNDPERWSVMLDYAPSEFSRFRLQYNRDESLAQADDQIYLQYVVSLGPHGAHRF